MVLFSAGEVGHWKEVRQIAFPQPFQNHFRWIFRLVSFHATKISISVTLSCVILCFIKSKIVRIVIKLGLSFGSKREHLASRCKFINKEQFYCPKESAILLCCLFSL